MMGIGVYLLKEVDDHSHVVVRLDKDLQMGPQFEDEKVLHDRQAVAQTEYPAKDIGRTLTFALVAVEEGGSGTLHSNRSVKRCNEQKKEEKEKSEKERKKNKV